MGTKIQNKKEIYYELPEKGIKKEEFLDKNDKLNILWDNFKFNIENDNVMNYQEITHRAEELDNDIKNVERLAIEANIPPPKQMAKRKNFINYVKLLNRNGGVDENNFVEKDFEEPRSENLRKLMLNQRFWRNVGQQYNQKFDKKIHWEPKVQKLEMEIEETHKLLDEMEAEEERKEREIEQEHQRRLIEQREEEFHDIHNYQKDEISAQDYEYDIEQQGQEEFIKKEREEQQKAQKIERENEELEYSILRLEDEKKKMEVELIRKN